jgi:hypothetical protein
VKIALATMSGPDNNTDIQSLIDISKKFFFVEWGILFSEKRFGTARYPDLDWQNSFVELTKNNINYTVHLCGKSIRNVIVENVGIELVNKAKGIQLNLNKDSLNYSTEIIDFIKNNNKDNIIQMNGINDQILNQSKIAYPLFDMSGGNGTLPPVWPKPIDGLLCGYAGGLGPDNLKEQLGVIGAVVGDAWIWVDMESNIRTGDIFDLDKVVQCLEIIKPYVERKNATARTTLIRPRTNFVPEMLKSVDNL